MNTTNKHRHRDTHNRTGTYPSSDTDEYVQRKLQDGDPHHPVPRNDVGVDRCRLDGRVADARLHPSVVIVSHGSPNKGLGGGRRTRKR